jgi:hypothetical protein
MKLLLVLPFAGALVGCTTVAYQAPPPATTWAYTGQSAPIYGLRVVGYAESKELCELLRAQDLHGTTKEHPYLAATFSAACSPAVIGPGTDYWAYALPPLYVKGQAFGTRDHCELIRKSVAPNVVSACAPVSVHFLAPLQKGAQK